MGKEKTLEQKYENSSSISAIYPSFYLIQKDYKLDEKNASIYEQVIEDI